MTPRRLAGAVGATVLLVTSTSGCTSPDVDVEGVARWQDRTDDAFRSALDAAGSRIALSPDDELAGLADTQRCDPDDLSRVRHRVDATLELAEPAPADLADRVREAVPAEYQVEVEIRPDAVVLGVVSGCIDLPKIQGVDVFLEGRYRVDP
ncbi:hypothetical protein [Aeromicrobium sp. 50.2.37]|uniref:hypothetical protein n=1 Tax=Aeromicrobium sp. 50.2.37 TaxID=2969305 RepID=UPI00214FACFF|nr:hypothetical protein [Aeromicrobium sp. 50.2.37]MCR4514187.1 hypothetical protein [Aeromicrobium sp. 50.2.37]